MRLSPSALSPAGILGFFTIALAGCGGESAPAGSTQVATAVDSAPDSIVVSEGLAVFAKDKLKCPGGDDKQTPTRIDAAAGGTARVNGHTLEFPPGVLSGNTYVYMMDVDHKNDLKVRIGMKPRRTLSQPVMLTFDLTRCNPVPTEVDVEHEDAASTVGPADVTGTKAAIEIDHFSTYVLSMPGKRGPLDSLTIPLDTLAP